MNILRVVIIIVCLILNIKAIAQVTPEQKKQIEDAQKKAMEMMQNHPEAKKILEQLQQMEAQKEAQKEIEQAKAEERRTEQHKEHMEEYYWRNKIASDNQGKFSNWSWGSVRIGYYAGDGRIGLDGKIIDKKYVILGRIDQDGEVHIELPVAVETNRVISRGFMPEMQEFSNDEIEFSNPQAAYLYTGYVLQVLDGENDPMGILYLGNSERTTHNLASPAMLNYGDKGYLLYWAYIAEACTGKLDLEQKNVKIAEGEVEKTVDRLISVDLNFTPGWNLVQIEVPNNYQLGSGTRWKNKNYRVLSKMPADAKYYFRLND